MILIKPKIIGELYGADMKRFINNPGDKEDVLGDIFITLKHGTPGSNTGMVLEMLQGDMKIKEWFDGLQSQIDFVLIGCGFSSHNEAQVEQTATEIKSKNQTTSDTIRLLKQLRLDQLTTLTNKKQRTYLKENLEINSLIPGQPKHMQEEGEDSSKESSDKKKVDKGDK